MKLWVEKYYPVLLASAAAYAWWRFSPSFPRDEKEFLGAAISVGSIFTGFIATAKAILAALPNDSLMERLRESGYIKDLASYLTQALYGCLSFSVYGMAGFFFLEQQSPSLGKFYAIGWIFLAIFSLTAFHRVASLLIKIISHGSR
ncbi:hypothetical protein N5D66_10185 [Delftia tsuruhatensis]|uniref:hypothetical protein n=1 Tax=Delftia tsuruhatensis TaxID=180282 RepID=UPI00105441D0|nr:hypothetical protein [Delftia tsuruhatensis]MDH0848303.1 hypothetical protein [Delftia tsuruhatensis]TDF24289.1 hypothetical protein EZI45_21725 [Delftia tsuruhatensis]